MGAEGLLRFRGPLDVLEGVRQLFRLKRLLHCQRPFEGGVGSPAVGIDPI